MSKRGSPYLRHALWQCQPSGLTRNSKYYERRLVEGKHRNVILGAGRQLLNRIFVILKEQRPYEIRSLVSATSKLVLTFHSAFCSER